MTNKKRLQRSIRKTVLLPILLLSILLTLCACSGGSDALDAYREKADELKAQVLSKEIATELGFAPAGDVGHAVFISVCDKAQRARVFTGTGSTPEAAWNAANTAAETAVKRQKLQPVWVKADAVYLSEQIPMADLAQILSESTFGSFRYGAAFDSKFEVALLEAELNSAGIYDYEAGCVNEKALEAYTKEIGRTSVKSLPDTVTVFQCAGWICDEDGTVTMLNTDGRRRSAGVEAEQAKQLALWGTDYLAKQLTKDGTFPSAYAPMDGTAQDAADMQHQAAAIYAMLRGYCLYPDSALAEKIDLAVETLKKQITVTDDLAFVRSGDQLPLGADGMAILALTEYDTVFQKQTHRELCLQLGNGMLSRMDGEGCFTHVLNSALQPQTDFVSVTYDGLAVYALCRLYDVTGEASWLDTAKTAADRFIAEGYAFYQDPWVTGSVSELTRHTDKVEYEAFVLQCAANLMDSSAQRNSANQVTLLQLVYAMNAYDRMLSRGITVSGFDTGAFLTAIRNRSAATLNSCFLPEFAMYMPQPETVLGSYMTRSAQFDIHTEDVVMGILAYDQYRSSYDLLLAFGYMQE